MFKEKELYEMLKEYYDILGVDENVDEAKLKKAYRFAAKKYHPDTEGNTKESEEKFKKVSEAFIFLKDENNRKVYAELKKRYEREHSSNSTKRKHKTTFYSNEEQYERQYKKQPEKEKINKYIFQRRDGSKIEIQPCNKYFVENQTIYKYRINQFYKDMTIIDDVYGRINLEELLGTPEYCDFCINNLLSRDNIYKSQIHYNGYIGHVEVTNKNGRKFYRVIDKDLAENFDISCDIGNIREEEHRGILISGDMYDIWVGQIGKIVINGKPLNQYLVFSDILDVMFIIYSEEIEFSKIGKDKKYSDALLEKLFNEERLKQKVKDGGYIGQVLYNVTSDDYDIIVDRDVEKVLNVKAKKDGRI